MVRWLVIGCVAPALAWAAPVQLQHSGRLLDSQGTPVEDPVVLRFGVYDAPSGGAPLWTEDLSVDPDGGFYAVTLGADEGSNPLQDSLFDGEDRYLQVAQVQSGGVASTFGTRQLLTRMPYAVHAQRAVFATSAAAASTATTATFATTADSATTAGSADTALVAEDAQTLAGRSLGAIEVQARSMGNLNVNPCFEQGFTHYVQYSGAGSVVDTSSSLCGTTAYENAPNTSTWIHSASRVPLDRSGTYEVSGSFRRTETTGSAGSYYLAVVLYDADGSVISGDGTWWYYPASGVTVLDTSWHSESAVFGAGTDHPFPSNARFMSVGAILNYNGTSGGRTYQVTGLGIQAMPHTPAWHVPTFDNGWVEYGNGYGPAGYTRDANGTVHLRGLIRAGTATSGTVAFTLPEGFRPTSRRLFSCTTGGAGAGDQGDHARCDVLSDGRVMLYNVSNEWVSLDGMSFTTW